MNEVGYYPENLFEIRQEIIDNDSCYLEWDGDITDRMLCAAVENEIDSCSGKVLHYIICELFRDRDC